MTVTNPNERPFEVGQMIEVGPAYVGSGRFEPDGATGLWWIVKVHGDGNFRIARTQDGPYSFTVHESRFACVQQRETAR